MVTARRCAFLDRDGVINVKPADGEYVHQWEDFRLVPEAVDWIRLLNALGYLVVVVTNQRGVALGRVEPAELQRIHDHMRHRLAAYGARIDDIFVCPHHENTCDCRKPRTGLVRRAQRKWNIDLATSILIGDSECDRQLARNCGLDFVRVRDGRIVEVASLRHAGLAAR